MSAQKSCHGLMEGVKITARPGFNSYVCVHLYPQAIGVMK